MTQETLPAEPPTARPAVTPDDKSQPFFDACGRGVLVIKRCARCATWNAPAAYLCWSCVSEDLDWEAVCGRATLHTFGIVHQVSHPGFRGEVPYNVAVVELEEGPRINSHIIECANADLEVGMKLAVRFVMLPNGVAIPKFAPTA